MSNSFVAIRVFLLTTVAACSTHSVALNEYGNPLRHEPRPTSAAITEDDLRTRMYVFADDSMMGRMTGREGNMRGTDYIARELARMGVAPGGENDTYFQALPFVQRRFTPQTVVTADGRPLAWLTDVVVVPSGPAATGTRTARAVYGGVVGDTAFMLAGAAATGRVVVLSMPAGASMAGGPSGLSFPLAQSVSRYANAAAVALVNLESLSPNARRFLNEPAATLQRPGVEPPATTAPLLLRVTPAGATALLGTSVASAEVGREGAAVRIEPAMEERPVPQYARNVIGIIRGSDPALANTYVVIGSHNDHVGFNTMPVDHDSARAQATMELARQMAGGELRPLTAAERASIRVNVDSLRALRPARLDSIFNGADDDGSGSVAMLEVAEAIQAMPVKPRRSVLFIWHTAEEGGLVGSRWFVDRPTVPRDSMVTMINLDMVGRGRAEDIPGGGPDYLAVVGSRRLSTELGNAVVSVNLQQARPFRLDYRFDEPTTWPGYNNIYQRSDHWNYARCNIPIAFFFTGLHQDYHRVTDEPQYIDFAKLTAVSRYVNDLAVHLGNMPRRPAVDQAGPPAQGC